MKKKLLVVFEMFLALIACGKSKLSTNTQANKNDISPYPEDYDLNYPYICNRVNNLYHLTSCPDLLTQESKVFIYYKTEEEAKQYGHIPCPTCICSGE